MDGSGATPEQLIGRELHGNDEHNSEGGPVSPDERAEAAEGHEAVAVAAQDVAEQRAGALTAEVAHLRTLAAALERHALPVLDPDRRHEEVPASDVTLPDWALPPAVLTASLDIDDGIAAAREWAAGELDALRERVEA